MNKSHLTAIKRNKISAPTAKLISLGKIQEGQNGLDYGCGRGFDADSLGFDKYDPYYFPKFPSKTYDRIICNYVLNVLEEDQESDVINKMLGLLNKNGELYISVRRDIKKDGYTSRETFQRTVYLPFTVLFESKNYCLYMVKKEV